MCTHSHTFAPNFHQPAQKIGIMRTLTYLPRAMLIALTSALPSSLQPASDTIARSVVTAPKIDVDSQLGVYFCTEPGWKGYCEVLYASPGSPCKSCALAENAQLVRGNGCADRPS